MSDTPPAKLRDISTHRSLLGDPVAMEKRYGRVIRAYALAILDDRDASAEVLSELKIKILRGDFARWQPGRGRFRDYLKQSVRNEALKYARTVQNRRLELQLDADAEDASGGPEGNPYLQLYRGAVIDAGLRALRAYQAEHAAAGNVFHTLVGLMTAHPYATDAELAALLATATGRPYSVDNLATQKRRARRKLAELLVEEIRALDDLNPEEVKAEVAVLGLGLFIEPFLPNDRAAPGAPPPADS